MKKILVIEDDHDMWVLYNQIFKDHLIYCVDTVEKAVVYLHSMKFDVLIIDLFLYGRSPGYTVIPYVDDMKGQHPKIIFYSAFARDFSESKFNGDNFNDYIYIQKGSLNSINKLKGAVLH